MKRIGFYCSDFSIITKSEIEIVKKYIKKLSLNKVFFLLDKQDDAKLVKIAINSYRKMDVLTNTNNIFKRFKNNQLFFIGDKVDEAYKSYGSILLIKSNVEKELAKKGDLKYINKNVKKYLTQHNIFIETITKNFYTDKRWNHALSVANLARMIAISNNIDPDKAYRAGLYHDIAKKLSLEDLNEYMRIYGNDFEKNQKEEVLHQYVSSYMAKRILKEKDKDVLISIKHHCLGDNLSPLSKIIYCADKLDPTRGYDSSMMINICMNNIDNGYEYVYNHNQEYLKDKGVL